MAASTSSGEAFGAQAVRLEEAGDAGANEPMMPRMPKTMARMAIKVSVAQK